MYRIRDIEQVKPSLRGVRVEVVSSSKEGTTIKLLEDTEHYERGRHILTFPEHLEEEE